MGFSPDKAYVTLYEDKENEDGEKISALKVSDHDEENVILDCPALAPGILTTFTPFGRRKRGKHIIGDI